METRDIVFHPIGVVRTPNTDPEGTPVQPVFAGKRKGSVILQPGYAEGLADLDGFSHIYLLYFFHRSSETKLMVKPFLDDEARGIFATRAPCRPNKIGFSVVELISIEGNVLDIQGVDILDGTPLLDIKPYIHRFDARENVRSGWQDGISDMTARRRGSRDSKTDHQ